MESPENKPNEDIKTLLGHATEEIRIQMFCYYHTLAWQIFAAILATVLVLATLPFLADGKESYFFFDEVCTLLVLGGGLCLVRHLRIYGDKWVSFSSENDRIIPRMWIDQIEIGNWKTNRTREFDKFLVGLFIAMVLYIVLSRFFHG